MDEKVAIILSSYNGEKYIAEQMNSLVEQSYKNIEIFIHDDGSKDSTVKIVNEYSNRYSNVHLLDGKKGLGYPTCFIALLEQIEGFKYYAFSDQDDVWMPNKISEAVKQLDMSDNNLPLLYYTAVEYCDSNLNYIRESRFAEGKKGVSKLTLQSLLFGGEAMGMTFVFNNMAREALLEANKDNTYKDWFLKVYCASCGAVYYNPLPSAKYRRHEMAVTNESNPSGKFARYVGQFKEIFLNKEGFESQKKVINYLNQNKDDKILDQNKGLIDLFSEPNSIKKRLKKLTWKERFRTKTIDEMGYRVTFLLGRI